MKTLRAIRKTNTHSIDEKIIRMTTDISSEKKNWNTETMQCHNYSTERKRGKPRILY